MARSYFDDLEKKVKDFEKLDGDYGDSLEIDSIFSDNMDGPADDANDMDLEDPMFGKDESELSNMGEEPLSEGFDFAGLFDKIGKTDFEGVGGGGKEEKSKISQITGANDPTRGSSSFSPVANPYTAGLPKYSQSSGNYMQLAQQIFGLLSPVRKPNISSLV
jgi:hypothetical protein